MSKNRASFPEEKQAQIDRICNVKRVLWISLICFILGFVVDQDWMVPFFEWCSALLLINYFALVSDFDDYYDSVANLKSNFMQKVLGAKA
eukprot:CAMPEP_0170543790 /NCGR_PEP_ID=MMETSP0211-20121228/2786_1 /TAXON_ID=311385 /ORGANISM="Pseudokeronopsis sp., Strain OXSARD2" /LENGTH=89 /DNA_ID=CAMNT_0010847257 /DNA_START=625 /DNA_END=894 /DNA_ORIENTATION=-